MRVLPVPGLCLAGECPCFHMLLLEVRMNCKLVLQACSNVTLKDGFHLQKRQSQRVPPTIVTDFDFADDYAYG